MEKVHSDVNRTSVSAQAGKGLIWEKFFKGGELVPNHEGYHDEKCR